MNFLHGRTNIQLKNDAFPAMFVLGSNLFVIEPSTLSISIRYKNIFFRFIFHATHCSFNIASIQCSYTSPRVDVGYKGINQVESQHINIVDKIQGVFLSLRILCI